MLTFFHGWRRKMGAATLVLAYVLVAGWIRSHELAEVLSLHHKAPTILFVSGCDQLGFSYGCYCHSIEVGLPDLPTVVLVPDGCNWNGYGFYYDSRPAKRFAIGGPGLLVPYWSIVHPMILLSALLLLSKPRIAKPAAATEN